MPGVHDYSKFIKRGFGRTTDHVSADVRAGLLTRDEAMELIKKLDGVRPEVLDYYLQITGFTEREFIEIVKKHREGKMLELPEQYPMKESPAAAPSIRPAVLEMIDSMSGKEEK
jgi:hypothetical protein